jgi:hypothetical protein
VEAREERELSSALFDCCEVETHDHGTGHDGRGGVR